MPSLRPPNNYEPTANAKTWWLFSPNFGYHVKAGKHFPGLFGTEHFWIFILLFLAVIGGEWWGIHTLWIKLNKTWVDVLWSFILIDIIIASFNHVFVGKIRKLNNQILVEKNEVERNKLIRKKNNRKLYRTLLILLIFAIASFKLSLFYMIKMGKIDGEMIQWFFIYFIIALIHSFATGFLIFELIANIIWERQKRKMKFSNNTRFHITDFRHFNFSSTIVLKTKDNNNQPCSASAGGQKFHKLIKTTDDNNYTIETWGVLDDVAVKQLKDFQDDDDQREKLAEACLKHQLEILENDAVRPAAN